MSKQRTTEKTTPVCCRRQVEMSFSGDRLIFTSVTNIRCMMKKHRQTTRAKISWFLGFRNSFGNKSLTEVIKHSTDTNCGGIKEANQTSVALLCHQLALQEKKILHVCQRWGKVTSKRSRQSRTGEKASWLLPEGRQWRPNLDLKNQEKKTTRKTILVSEPNENSLNFEIKPLCVPDSTTVSTVTP